MPDPSTRAFWDAAREGKLLIGRNIRTGRVHYPPRPVCPFDDEGRWNMSPPAARARSTPSASCGPRHPT
ncbi:zinc ribbon domain-containing protein [Pseudoroseomonas wenyumeiae]